MYKKKFHANIITESNKESTFINFQIIIKQLFPCIINKLFVIVLCVTFASETVLASDTIPGGEETAFHVPAKSLSTYDYLKQHSDFPVDFLFSVYRATKDLQEKWPEASHPLFSTLKYKKKRNSGNKPFNCSFEASDLNSLLSYTDGIKYIDRKQLIPVLSIPLYRWLIKEYGAIDYKDHPTTLLTITMAGMLFDLEQREKNGDSVARLALEFLKHPYVKVAPSSSADNSFFIYRWMKSLQKMLLWSKELTFPERLATLTDSPYTDEQSKFKRFLALKRKGYQYQHTYTFTSYEIDEAGNTMAISSDDIVQADEQVVKNLKANETIVTDPINYPDSSDSALSVNLNTTGIQAADSAFKKTCAVAFSALCFFSMINSGLTASIPPRQCEAEGNCGPQNYYSLSNNNFISALQQNRTGNFKLAENITLNTQQNLPVSHNCSAPFSGALETGDFTIHAENGTSPLFGCIDQASISGNFNVCSAGLMNVQPVVAAQVLNESMINIQQADHCETQRPILGDIVGDNNHIIFTGSSKETVVPGNTGIVANHISGSHNILTAENAKLLNAPIVAIGGGSSNTYQQKNMGITRHTQNYLSGNQFLVADQLTGSNTTIIQHNINATFITPSVPDPNIPDRNISNAQSGTANILSSNTVIKVASPEDATRITSISDRSVITNNGRLEIYRNGTWKPVCEDTLDEKTANVACRSMRFFRAESEGYRLRLKEAVSQVKLDTAPIHANKDCTGYEQHLKQCATTSTDKGACLKNGEAFISCSNEKVIDNSRIKLTDPYSNLPDRFDTTRNGWGRLEVLDLSPALFSGNLSLRGDIHTVCGTGFDNNSANIACHILGYHRGHVAPVQAAPLPEEMPIFSFNWADCDVRNVVALFFCRFGGRNLTDHNCTHSHDAVVSCDQRYAHHYTIRLTDRHSTDKHRADITDTGFGRVEIHNRFLKKFVGLCPENVNDKVANAACWQRGFKNGTFSHLSAKPISLSFYNSSQLQLDCNATQNDIRRECSKSLTNNPNCTHPDKNLVLLCNNGEVTPPRMLAKSCHPSDHTSNTAILFAGEFDWDTDGCEFNQCPVMLWDADGVQASDAFRQQCNGTQRLQTTRREDWLKMWSHWCKLKSDNCHCHLPNEQFLGLVFQEDHPNKTLLVSRQQYLYNTHVSDQGAILVSKLFTNEAPQVLRPANETLLAEAIPVSQIVTEQHLVGLYSSEQEDRNIQLLWSSLESNNDRYHVQTLQVTGEPLLLTESSVFVKDTANGTIVQYPLNSTAYDNNTTGFTIGNIADNEISFPENATNIIAATMKNGWLYVATTDNTDTDLVYIKRYNTTTDQWEYDWQQTCHFNNSTNKIIVEDDGQAHCLSAGQIPLIHPVFVSIPDAGGCTLLSNETIPETTMQPETEFPGGTDSTGTTPSDEQSFLEKNKQAIYPSLIVGSAMFVFCCCFLPVYTHCCKCIRKCKKHDIDQHTSDDKSTDEENDFYISSIRESTV